MHERDLETIAHYGEAPVIGKARTVYSERYIRAAFLEPTLEFAGFEFDAVYGFFSEGSKSTTKRLMGQRLLRDCRLTFDQRKRRVRVIRELRPPAVELSPERLQEWVGEYSNAARSLTIRLEGDSLRVRFLAWIIHGDTHPTSQTLAFGSLSAPGGTLRNLRSSTTRPGIPFQEVHWTPWIRYADRGLPLRAQMPPRATRGRVAVFGAYLHE